ncbi:MAG: Gx transporter family protein [Oscillospiraceae bacterium]|nr:Gx transporter family protein [Oscillospiraceae bacterium]MBP1574879.1 Gx transporter family protein [Oscillospiraceae bacterium]MBQ8594418.1 Gx transporter family protein [Oscillospiraceae bacterium]
MKTKKVAMLGLTIALAMIMSYIEALVPLSFAVPGIKMGLANIVIIFVLYKIGTKEAILVSLIRVILVSLLFSNVMAMAYSIAGAVLSLSVMWLLKKTDKFSVIGVSIAGGIMHNVGQIIMAVILLGTEQIALYLPVLIITGTATGVVIGIVSGLVINRFKNIRL